AGSAAASRADQGGCKDRSRKIGALHGLLSFWGMNGGVSVPEIERIDDGRRELVWSRATPYTHSRHNDDAGTWRRAEMRDSEKQHAQEGQRKLINGQVGRAALRCVARLPEVFRFIGATPLNPNFGRPIALYDKYRQLATNRVASSKTWPK
ncbi:MAG: hypothetical protein KGJ62_14305, partial [Armatimonadetes bacterium]|nr:hypothetical protein [Armatimonadota bacterium]